MSYLRSTGRGGGTCDLVHMRHEYYPDFWCSAMKAIVANLRPLPAPPAMLVSLNPEVNPVLGQLSSINTLLVTEGGLSLPSYFKIDRGIPFEVSEA